MILAWRRERKMPKRASTLLVMCLVATCGFAKDKNKGVLPAYVLQAHTVSVIIDPGAGMSIDDPRANQVAQKDVETALLNWGRFEPVLGTRTADLVIVVRKGNRHLMDETIPNPRQNNRAGVINPTDNGVAIGGQHGPQPGLSDDSAPGYSAPGSGPRTPQSEIGTTDDSFVVYRGDVERPLDAPAAWRYVAADGLLPQTVPAVAAFKKAVADAEKAAAKHP
jgi:hypothetical protein